MDSVLKLKEGLQRSSLQPTIPFSILMIGIEQVMEKEFSCPCEPLLNQLLAAFIFITPALLAFIVMFYIVRPCKKCSCQRCTRTVLPCLIPPLAWVLWLLLDGQYLDCALTFHAGTYTSDYGDPPVKWCERNSSGATEDKESHELIVEWSQIAGLVALSATCCVIVCAVGCMDCRQASEEDVEIQNIPSSSPS